MSETLPDVPDPDIPIRMDTAVLDTHTDTHTITGEKPSATPAEVHSSFGDHFRRELMQALSKLPAGHGGKPMTVRSAQGRFYKARFPKLAGEQPAEEGAEVDDVVITPLPHMNDRKPGPDWTFRMNGHLSVQTGEDSLSLEELRKRAQLRRSPPADGETRDPSDLERSDVATEVSVRLSEAVALVNAEAWKIATRQRQAELIRAQRESASRVAERVEGDAHGDGDVQ